MSAISRFAWAGGVYLALVAAYAAWSYQSGRTEILAAIDRELLAGARTVAHLLPEEYHDRAINAEAIAAEEYDELLQNLSRWSWEVGFIHAYTAIRVDDQIILTSSNASRDEWERGELVTYFEHYDDASQEFRAAFDVEHPTFTSYVDKWGAVRSGLIPLRSPGGQSTWLGSTFRSAILTASCAAAC